MTDDTPLSFPSVLRFTPEVQSGELAATALALGNFTTPDPSEMDLEILAHELLRYAPELARDLLQVGLAKFEAA